MVKRFPENHKAEVTIEVDGKVVGGEWVEGRKENITISGRFDQSNSSQHIKKLNRNGNLLEVLGEYHTTARKPEQGTPIHISIPGIDLNKNIIVWEDYQSHSVIYL